MRRCRGAGGSEDVGKKLQKMGQSRSVAKKIENSAQKFSVHHRMRLQLTGFSLQDSGSEILRSQLTQETFQ